MCEYFSQVHAVSTRGSRHHFWWERSQYRHPPPSPIYHNKWVERATCGLLIFLGPKNFHICKERQINVSIKNVDFVPKTMFRSVCSSVNTFYLLKGILFQKKNDISMFKPLMRHVHVGVANHSYLLHNKMQVVFTLWHHLLKRGKRRKLEMVPTSIHRR